MGLLAYFKQASVNKESKVNNVLPKSDSSLSKIMPMSSIGVANAAVHEVMMKAPKVKEHEVMNCDEQIVRKGKYQYFTDTERLVLGKRAYNYKI